MTALTERRIDLPMLLLAGALSLGLAAFLAQGVGNRYALLFLIGIGLGVSLLHAAFGFAGGWRSFIRERRGQAIRAQLLLLALSCLLFFPFLAGLFPELRVAGAVAPVGVSVLVGAFLFGIGMQLGGGCGSGTLFTVGGGHVRMLITLAFFVTGATIGSVHLPWWQALPAVGKVSLIDELGWIPALLAQLAVFGVLFFAVARWEQRVRGEVEPLTGKPDSRSLLHRLLRGPWPIVWGAVGLSLLGLATLLVAHHPWSITFAFGLWGTKIWSALGGDISQWTYWSSGYPARALEGSVLTDTTSLMDFGIILGAILAASLQGRFAPATSINLRDVATAVIGGLLLGYGARLAFGCNIGGLLAGISSGSLHGWLWLVAGFAGAIVGVKLRVLTGMDKPQEKAA